MSKKKPFIFATVSAETFRPRVELCSIFWAILSRYKQKIYVQEIFETQKYVGSVFSVKISHTPRAARSVYLPLLTENFHLSDIYTGLHGIRISVSPASTNIVALEKAIKYYLQDCVDDYSLETISRCPTVYRIVQVHRVSG